MIKRIAKFTSQWLVIEWAICCNFTPHGDGIQMTTKEIFLKTKTLLNMRRAVKM